MSCVTGSSSATLGVCVSACLFKRVSVTLVVLPVMCAVIVFVSLGLFVWL